MDYSVCAAFSLPLNLMYMGFLVPLVPFDSNILSFSDVIRLHFTHSCHNVAKSGSFKGVIIFQLSVIYECLSLLLFPWG